MTDDAQSILERIVAEEADVVYSRFDLDDAWRLGARMRTAAAAASLPIVIGITLGEARVFHTALPGSSADNDAWLDRKTRVARRYGRSSYGVGQSFRAAGQDFDVDARLDTTLYAAHGGVFPITVAGVGVVGTAGVSGLPQADDHAFVVEQLRAYRREQHVATAGAPAALVARERMATDPVAAAGTRPEPGPAMGAGAATGTMTVAGAPADVDPPSGSPVVAAPAPAPASRRRSTRPRD